MFGAMEEFFMEMEVEEEVWLGACLVCPWKWNIILIYVCIHNVKRPKWPQLKKKLHMDSLFSASWSPEFLLLLHVVPQQINNHQSKSEHQAE